MQQQLGKYQLVRRLATGGMAELFLGSQRGPGGFEKTVVIKRLLPSLVDRPEMVEQFLDEARIAAQLDHPNIVKIYDLGRTDGEYFIAMEYIHGRDLETVRVLTEAQGGPSHAVCTYVMAAVCRALQHAHELCDERGAKLGLVHRDVSPHNVLVGHNGAVKLLDFGVAKATNRADRTQAGVFKGKFAYMSPEQCRGQPIDGRSDIFCAGIVLYELVCNRRLFQRESQFATMYAVMEGEIPPPQEVADVEPPLAEVISTALQRDPKERYPSAMEMSEALDQVMRACGWRLRANDVAEFVQSLPEPPSLGGRTGQQGVDAALADTLRSMENPIAAARSDPALGDTLRGGENPLTAAAGGAEAAPRALQQADSSAGGLIGRESSPTIIEDDYSDGPTVMDTPYMLAALAPPLDEEEQTGATDGSAGSSGGVDAVAGDDEAETIVADGAPHHLGGGAPPPLPGDVGGALEEVVAHGAPRQRLMTGPGIPSSPPRQRLMTGPGIPSSPPPPRATSSGAASSRPSPGESPPPLPPPPRATPGGGARPGSGAPPSGSSRAPARRRRSPDGAVRPADVALSGRVARPVAAPQPRQRSRGWLLVVLLTLLILAIATATLLLWFRGRRAGGTSLLIRSKPSGATVYLDGERQRGVTPLVLRHVQPGKQHAIAAMKDGYRAASANATPASGAAAAVELKLERRATGHAKVSVRSTPAGAAVFLDGERRGETPVEITHVKAGVAHSVVVQHSGYRPARRAIASLRAGQTHALQIELEQLPPPEERTGRKTAAHGSARGERSGAAAGSSGGGIVVPRGRADRGTLGSGPGTRVPE